MSGKQKTKAQRDWRGKVIFSMFVAAVLLILGHLYLSQQPYSIKLLGIAGLLLILLTTAAFKYNESRLIRTLLKGERERLLREQMESALQEANKELHQAKKQQESLIDSSTDAIVAADRKGKVVLFNTGAEVLLGYKRQEIIGRHVGTLYNSVDYARGVMRQMRNSGGKVSALETLLKAKDGELIPVLISASILYDDEGNEAGSVGFSKDLRERKELEGKLEELATTDSVTKLYNRTYFASKLEEEFQRSVRYDIPLSLLILDIDYFKSVNDTFGHRGGDAYLKALAALIFSHVRRVDTVARYGGEEMVVIMPHTKPHEALLVAERLREKVASFEVLFEGHSILRTISIGVTSSPEAQAKTADELLKVADSALYEAKRGGRNRSVLRRIPESVDEKLQS